MTLPDQWRQIQDLYFRALGLPAERRQAFLHASCQDRTMRQEVESLLMYEGRIDGFLDVPPDLDVPPHADGFISAGSQTRDDTLLTDELIGEIIDDRYVVTQRVGSGGMGVVYRAEHQLMGTSVAIKRLATPLRERKEYRKQAVDEARRGMILDHENVARVKDVVEEGNEVFVVMEFIDGETLKARLDRPPNIDEFLAVAIQCASALRAAHEKRIVHLDIKPANIMLTASGHVKICDFGMARELSHDRTEAEGRWTFGGTPAYMAPEVLEGNQFDVAADLFSLGVVFYEWLSGKHPFKSTDVRSTTNRILKETPPSLRDIRKLPGRLTRLIEKMLAKNPENRLTATETLHELRAIQFRQTALKSLRAAPREVLPLVRRRPVAALSSITMVAIVAVALVYFRPLSTMGYAPLPAGKQVAVLPFRVPGDRPDKLFYARGISEMLAGRLMELTAIPTLRVEPPSSIRERNIDTVQKARVELGANIVIDGMFEFAGDQAMFYYSLIRTSDGTPLRWGTVKSSNADDFAFVDDIIQEVSSKLEVELAPQKGSRTPNRKAFALYRDGMGFLSQYHSPENLEAAVQHFSQAVEIDGSYAEAYAALGRTDWYRFQEKNQELSLLDQSLEACKKADALTGGSSDAQVCIGRVFQERGDYETAIRYYRQALKYSATNDEAFQALGRVLEEQNRFDEAEKEYLRAIELRPGYWAPQAWIAGFYDTARHEYTKARDHYNAALSISKDNARVHYSIASAFVNLGQYDMAVKSLQESTHLRPWAPRPASNLGLAYLMWRKDDDALRELKKAFDLEKPGDLDTNYRITGNLARIYQLTHRTEEARQMYELAINQGKDKLLIDARDPAVHILLGRYYAEIGKKDDAKGHLRLALKAKPDDPHYLLIAATAYVALKERDNALSCMEQAVAHGYTDIQLLAERELDALKTEPRYIALMSSLQKAK